MHKALICIGIIASLLPVAQGLAKGKTYQCWTDENGQRMCGDRVPPKYADKERQVIDDRGLVVETKERAKTPEEIAEMERQKLLAEEAKRAAEYDRSLIQTYRGVEDLETMRDERVLLLDTRILAAEKSVTDTEATLTDLRARADKNDKPESEAAMKLAKQIRQFERSLTDNQGNLARLQTERNDTQTKFNGDIARFKELKGIVDPPPPAPEVAAEKAAAEKPAAEKPAAAKPAAEKPAAASGGG